MGRFDNMVPGQTTPDQRGGGGASSVPADDVLQFAHSVNSSLSERTGAVQFSIAGIAGLDFQIGGTPSIPLANDAEAQTIDDAEQYSAPGIIGRPLPPRTITGQEQHMDVVCVMTADGLVPIAYRDLRLKMAGDAAPGEGVLAFVGYGGGFLSQSPVVDPNPSDPNNPDPSGGGTIQVMYCPYDFDSNGVAQKAHTIILDPTTGNESIMIVHADGMALTMSGQDKKAILLKNAAGDATLRLDDDGITLTAANIVLSGGVVVGEPAFAVPLLAGAASPPSSKFFVSP